MPANLPPDYFAAEERFRQAKTAEEKIRILEEMLAIMPKHKGTDHLQADLRAKISRLKKEGAKKKVTARFNPYAVEREDCPQVVFIGPANSGKSSLINALTDSEVSEAAEYPYTTVKPSPGIFRCDNYRFQLVDLPPVIGSSMEGWMGDLLRHADGAVIVLDTSREETLDQVGALFAAIDRANVFLQGLNDDAPPLGTMPQNALIALHKSDSALPEVAVLLKEQFGRRFPALETCSNSNLKKALFAQSLASALKIIRIYTKVPGKKADLQEPYIVDEGINIIKLAEVIHREMVENFRFARVWGRKTFEGQRVGKEHIIEDGDIVELHA